MLIATATPIFSLRCIRNPHINGQGRKANTKSTTAE